MESLGFSLTAKRVSESRKSTKRLYFVSQEALTLKEQQKQQKDAEHCLLKRQLQILLEENKTYLQGLEKEKKRSHLEVRRMNTDTE